MYKVSVIVPIYKVEAFIARCVDSLMSQTLEEIEFVFVDDCSPDDSILILKNTLLKYPFRKPHTRIITHNQNKGLPSARNTGLAVVSGEYVYHCDSDDYLEPSMLKDMYLAAVSDNTEIIYCDWYLSFDKNERYMRQREYINVDECVKGLLSGGLRFNVWNKLVKRSLYNNYQITFPSGYSMGEDMTMIMLFACANKIKHLRQAGYHYIKLNTNSYTQTISERYWIDIKHNVERVSNFIRKHCGDRYIKELYFLQLDVKLSLLFTGDITKYDLWNRTYPEANEFILQNKNVSIRYRLLQWCAYKKQYWLLNLYFHCVHKIVYGIIFK